MDNARWETASWTGGREANEDVVGTRDGSTSSSAEHPVAVICDGMGGYPHGAQAAELATHGFMAAYTAATASGAPVKDALSRALHAANDAVRRAIENNPRLYHMGTTLSAAALTNDGVEWINVGDSPIYLYEAATDKAREVGVRHNPPWRRNSLTSAVMGEEMPDIAASGQPQPLGAGDVVVIASDGIDTIGSDGVRAACAAKPDIARTTLARRLLEAVANAGAEQQDNTSVATMRATRWLPDRRLGTGTAFTGRRTKKDSEVWINETPLQWKRTLEVRNHSPSGPEWGYHGSGPSQLALAMLMEITDAATAVEYYQRFKENVIAKLPTDEWTIDYKQVADWLTTAQAAGDDN